MRRSNEGGGNVSKWRVIQTAVAATLFLAASVQADESTDAAATSAATPSAATTNAAVAQIGEPAPQQSQFTFSWPFSTSDQMRPRGGSTRGTAVTLLSGESDAWHALNAPGISKFERDRRAILAMAGEYRTSFDFIETVGFTADFEPARPYQSWSTEVIDVIEDTQTRISLQHIMVMSFVDADGDIQGPFVQKHWRQDWTFEDASIHEFVGRDRWRERRPDLPSIRGKWSQAVYQVDDSPRYEAYGEWVHDGNNSSWMSDTTWRPLPRRESSLRDDYHVLVGTNRHTITPTGWVQEEENLKAVLNADGGLDTAQPYIARELGLNRYERIGGFDFSAGPAYWSSTERFWADVRAAWAEIYSGRQQFVFDERADGVMLFQPMFEYAAGLEAGQQYDSDHGRAFISETLDRYVE
jgi:hypothetical protein